MLMWGLHILLNYSAKPLKPKAELIKKITATEQHRNYYSL